MHFPKMCIKKLETYTHVFPNVGFRICLSPTYTALTTSPPQQN